MKRGNAVGTALVAMALMATAAFGATNKEIQKPTQTASFATEYGKTLPPMAYVAFCGRAEGQDECNGKGKNERLKMTGEVWNQLVQVNNYVNTKIRPATDMEIYGVPDFWTYPVDTGDCEDYQLLKKKYLVGLGINADELLMTVVFDENGEGHAILTVATDQGDMILDNRRADILRWDRTGYVFLKRESQVDPKQWVSLRANTTQVLVGSKSN